MRRETTNAPASPAVVGTAVRALNALLADGMELTKAMANGIVRAHALAGEDDVAHLFVGNLARTSLAPPLWPDEETYGPVLRERVRAPRFCRRGAQDASLAPCG